MFRPAALLALGFTLAVSTGFRQDQWASQVRRQLDAVRDRMNLNGFALTHAPFIGQLDDSESETVQVQLDAGTEYYIIGACDNDCSDVDLQLRTRSGSVITQDIAADDYPVLRVTPARGGTYLVRATMAECSAEPCRFGIGVYGT